MFIALFHITNYVRVNDSKYLAVRIILCLGNLVFGFGSSQGNVIIERGHVLVEARVFPAAQPELVCRGLADSSADRREREVED